MTEVSLQDRYSPTGICFGCGPKNLNGLRIKSFPAAHGEVLATWVPKPEHQAFEGAINGGIVGSLLDCHGNWTAAYALMQRSGEKSPPSTVTAEYQVKLLRPTPSDQPLTLRARATEIQDDRAVIEATLESAGVISARFRGTFVAVKPGYPAYHRW